MALIQSFVPVLATRRLNRTHTECEYAIADDDEHGRLLILRTFSTSRQPNSSPTQVYDLDLAAARELRVILATEFGI
ncbi:hypothetical protein ACFVSK_09175 [Cellulosimicrobium cellulans]|uniref:hypothetical protein n=1 Tax=Cellulosimicrobium cellulans TaxID=1710 RepID=UPI0036EB8A5A